VRAALWACVEGVSTATKRHCKFVEVSALLDHKVDDLLVGIVRQIRLRQTRRDDPPPPLATADPGGGGGGGGGGSRRLAAALGGALRRLVARAATPTRRRRDPAADLFTP